MLTSIFSTMPMFVCTFWFFMLLLEFRRENKGKRFLCLFMLVSFILYMCHAAYFNKEYRIFPLMDSVYAFASLSVFPLYYVYVRVVTRNRELTWYLLLVLLPACVVGVSASVLYLLMPEEEMDRFVHQILYKEGGNFDFSVYGKFQFYRIKLENILFMLQLFPIVVGVSKAILNYEKQLKVFYSNSEDYSLRSLKRVFYVFIFTSFCSSLVNFVGKSYFVTSPWLLLFPSLLFSALLFGIGYLGFKQEFTMENWEDNMIGTDEKDTIIVSDDNKMAQIKIRLIEMLEQNEIYKKKDLRITDVALLLGTNRTYLSKIVNQELQTNFSDLINKYRVQHAKKKLSDPECRTLRLDVIADQSGFSNESTFNRIFKKEEALSPGKWRDQFCK